MLSKVETDVASRNRETVKAEQYGWKVLDSPGRFMMIHKEKLRVDHTYQRDQIRHDNVTKIARNFRWSEFGALTVAQREDQSFSIVDGQHRRLAALRIPSVSTLPCMVFNAIDLPAEARAFLGINSVRGVVRSVDRFKASTAAGDEVAGWVTALAERHGITISNTRAKGSIHCIALVLRLARIDRAALEAVLQTVIDLNEGHVIHERILDALFLLYRQHGERLLKRPIADRLAALGRQGLLDAAAKAASYHAKGGAKIWAKGIADEINKGLRTNRLSVEK